QLVLRSAEESEMEGPVYFALLTARDALGARVPPEVLEALRPWRWQTALAKRVFSGERLVTSPFAYRNYSALIAPLLASNWRRMTQASLYLAWRVPLRKFARHFPKLAPAHWRS